MMILLTTGAQRVFEQGKQNLFCAGKGCAQLQPIDELGYMGVKRRKI